jgi:hypothetical protein
MDLDVADWDKMLAQTLEDHRLSKSERQALKERLRDAALDDRVRAVLRSRVFEVARKKLDDVRTIPIVDWLEEVSKLLLPFSGPEGEPFVEAHFSPGEACVRRMAACSTASRRTPTSAFTITDNRIADGILGAHAAAPPSASSPTKAHDLGSDAFQLAQARVPVQRTTRPTCTTSSRSTTTCC